MGIMGKLIGGTIGFAIGGPLGAIAGAAFGHAYDASTTDQRGVEGQRLSYGEESQVTFFVGSFSMLAKLVRADGQIAKAEIESIEKFMLYDLNLDPQSRRVAMNIFQAAIESPQSFDDFAGQFYHQFRNQPQLLELMIDILIRVGTADGDLSQSEEKLILSAVSIFGMSTNQYSRIKSKYAQTGNQYYAVLKTDARASNEQIKSQYRKLVSEYHPDKIASKGLPEEFTKFANDKFREIQEAYEAIKRERGFK